MIFKRFLLLVLACSLPLSLFACGGAETTTAPESDTSVGETSSQTAQTTQENDPDPSLPAKEIVTKTYQVTEVLDSLKPLGRTSVVPTGLACDHVASGIEFNAYIQGKLTIDITVLKGGDDAREDDCL